LFPHKQKNMLSTDKKAKTIGAKVHNNFCLSFYLAIYFIRGSSSLSIYLLLLIYLYTRDKERLYREARRAPNFVALLYFLLGSF
jgi:hypothetical protein